MSSQTRYEMLFGDLFEMEYFFEMLDEWATAPDSARLDELCSDKSHVRQRVRAIRDRVDAVEKSNGMLDRHSHQYDLLTDLDWLLADTEHPTELAASLPSLKQQLHSAQMIADDIRMGRMEPAAKNEQKRKDGLKKANDDAHGKANQKRATFDAEISWRLQQNPHLSVTGAKKRTAANHQVCYRTVNRHSSRAEVFKKS